LGHSVSVIVPHHNRPCLLKEALLSIRDQTAKPAEVLVVDDASSPENREQLEELSSLATVLHTPRNIGLGAARNFGAEHANAEWLAFLDDDDVFLPDKIERQMRYLETHPECHALGGGLIMVSPDGRNEYWGTKETRRLTLADALHYTASMAQGLVIRRDVFHKLGGFASGPRFHGLEDYELGIRVVAAGYEMHFLAEPVFIYRLGGREQMSLQWGRIFRSNLAVLAEHRKLCREAFGPLGYIRLNARAFRNHGLKRGRLVGRAIWGAGCALEALFGRERGRYDQH
jgi:GT2 family glycosyltransferase